MSAYNDNRIIREQIKNNLEYLTDHEREIWIRQAPLWNTETHRFFKDDREVLDTIIKRKREQREHGKDSR